MSEATLRLDKFLWFARLAKSRERAQAIAEQGHVRLDGRRIERAHAPVRVGDVLSVPLPRGVRALRIESLPHGRVSARDVAAIYTDLCAPAPRLVDGARDAAVAGLSPLPGDAPE